MVDGIPVGGDFGGDTTGGWTPDQDKNGGDDSAGGATGGFDMFDTPEETKKPDATAGFGDRRPAANGPTAAEIESLSVLWRGSEKSTVKLSKEAMEAKKREWMKYLSMLNSEQASEVRTFILAVVARGNVDG